MLFTIWHLPVFAIESPKQILMITSYHQGDDWNDSIVAGVQEVFDKYTKRTVLFIEYLDIRRNDGDDHIQLFFNYLKEKYAKKNLDLIILSDDAALNFFIGIHLQFFEDVPAVFCGINNFKPEILAAQSNITGVNEEITLAETMEMAFHLFPDTKNIVAVCDDKSAVGKNNLNAFRNTADQFKDRAVFSEALNLKNTDIHDVLGKLSPDTLLFRLNNLLNAEENFVSIHETMAILSKEVSLPIFTAWDFDMGLGAIGGVLVSAMEQGRKAAALSIQIFEGASADEIPIIMKSPNIPFIDYQQIRRFGLTLKDLPEGVHLMNRSDSLWGKYKTVILFVLCFLFSLMIIVVLQTRHLKKRYEIEKTLKASEDEIKSIFRTAPVGIGSVVNRVFKKVNNRMCEICGYEESELIGRSARILYPSDADFEFVGLEKYDQITKHGIGTVETCWQRKDGSIVDVLLSSTFVDVADHAKRVTFTALDITDHKQTKNDLESQQRFLKAVFDNIEEAIVICDENGTLVQFNEAARKLHGLPEQPIKPQQWSEYYNLFKADGITPLPVEEIPLYRAFTGEHVRNTEIVVATPNSSLRHLVCNGQRLKNSAGKIIGAVVAMHDDTQRRMAELKQKKLQMQLNQAQKMESIGTLAGGIAHEFNNILSIIIGNNELIMEDLPEKSLARKNSEEIRLAGLRARDIVRHLLTFSRHDVSTKKPIEIKSVLKESLKLIRATTPTNIEIRDKIFSNCLPIYGDATQINQILINLCNNAIDALPISGGTIDIELCNSNSEENEAFLISKWEPGKYVKLTVRDNGIGMDKKIVEKIFEPYFTTKGVGEGSGIGLAVVHGIVKKHGGSIVCDSKKDQGTVFTILIPAYDRSVMKETDKLVKPVLLES